MSETPRTDAVECEIVPSADPNYNGPYRWVESSFARELERELAEARHEIQALTGYPPHIVAECAVCQNRTVEGGQRK